MKNLFLFITAIILGISNASFAYDIDEITNISVYEKINPAIVSIDAQIPDGFSAGTGCIIKPNGLILTGAHVVDGAQEIEIKIHNGQVYKARIITTKAGKNQDLAILKIDPKRQLQTVEFGDSDDLKVGQKILAIGNPFGFSGTLTQGIVSRIDYTKGRIQTDASINPGNSGGPLLNSKGQVIGISQSIYNPDNNISNIGIGFAIPINSAKKFIASAIADDERPVSDKKKFAFK